MPLCRLYRRPSRSPRSNYRGDPFRHGASYFMQDGATPHSAISTRRMIQDIFGDRVVGKHFPIYWPPYSPDLTPADFWLWPTLKRMLFNSRNQPYTSIGFLKKAITFAFNKLRQGNLYYLTPAVVKRLRLCQTNKGFRQ